jgi:hypothetical protein
MMMMMCCPRPVRVACSRKRWVHVNSVVHHGSSDRVTSQCIWLVPCVQLSLLFGLCTPHTCGCTWQACCCSHGCLASWRFRSWYSLWCMQTHAHCGMLCLAGLGVARLDAMHSGLVVITRLSAVHCICMRHPCGLALALHAAAAYGTQIASGPG